MCPNKDCTQVRDNLIFILSLIHKPVVRENIWAAFCSQVDAALWKQMLENWDQCRFFWNMMRWMNSLLTQLIVLLIDRLLKKGQIT